MERIIQMIINQVLRRVIRVGVNKGIELAADRMPKRGDTTQEQDANAKQQANEMNKRARQTMKLGRRLRF